MTAHALSTELLDRQDGTRRLYRLAPAGLEGLRAYWSTFWDAALAEFRAAVEATDEEER